MTLVRRNLKRLLGSNFCGKKEPMILSSTMSNLILKTSSYKDSTASLKRFFCCKKFPYNLSQCDLYPLPLVFSMWLLVKRELPLFLQLSIKYWNNCDKIPTKPYALCSRPHSFSPSSEVQVLETLHHLHDLLWTLSSQPT